MRNAARKWPVAMSFQYACTTAWGEAEADEASERGGGVAELVGVVCELVGVVGELEGELEECMRTTTATTAPTAARTSAPIRTRRRRIPFATLAEQSPHNRLVNASIVPVACLPEIEGGVSELAADLSNR
ncbi:MAG: hypothetical protein ACXVRQ_01785 [Gaiellaceae bacterium]